MAQHKGLIPWGVEYYGLPTFGNYPHMPDGVFIWDNNLATTQYKFIKENAHINHIAYNSRLYIYTNILSLACANSDIYWNQKEIFEAMLVNPNHSIHRNLQIHDFSYNRHLFISEQFKHELASYSKNYNSGNRIRAYNMIKADVVNYHNAKFTRILNSSEAKMIPLLRKI